MLSNAHLSTLVEFRHQLHRQPELSGEEKETAEKVLMMLGTLAPDELVTGLGPWTEADGRHMGGTGIAAVFDSGEEGPTLLFRCELDALPIEELSDLDYRSEIETKAHLCGHDGHMATLTGLGMMLAERRPAKGRVILLYQPAEETGKGAKAVLDDPRFAPFIPDYAFALHNLPGVKMGEVLLKSGNMCCASRGMRIRFEGKTSHASMPQDGLSPDDAICSVIAGLKSFSNGLNEGQELDDAYKLVTITHCWMGEPAFGVSPASGEVWATLRTVTDAAMGDLVARAEILARQQAELYGLSLSIETDDVFLACTNHEETAKMVASAVVAEAVPLHEQPDPMRFSEDFGLFGHHCPSTLFLLGSGESQPQLHNPDFDFPDQLIGTGARIFERIVREKLG
ncbi:MAG: amidohydrolase [Cohaesibacter sp.]|nr:amidohydrolase [Cohaesibacter sp.]